MTALEAFRAGQLSEAIALATDRVRNHPGDTDARSFLASLFCFAGEWERADKQLDTIMVQKTDLALGVSLLRQLVRAEKARDEFFESGRVPEVTNTPPEHLELALRALIELRDGQRELAAEHLTQAEAVRPDVSGTHNGDAFSGLRDLDDVLAGVCEVLTSTGKYYLVPFEQIVYLEFKTPETLWDRLWRQARMVVENGPDGEVYIPALYHGSCRSEIPQIRTGGSTEWIGDEETGPVRGIGVRELLVGDEAVSINELGTIERADGSE